MSVPNVSKTVVGVMTGRRPTALGSAGAPVPDKRFVP